MLIVDSFLRIIFRPATQDGISLKSLKSYLKTDTVNKFVSKINTLIWNVKSIFNVFYNDIKNGVAAR